MFEKYYQNKDVKYNFYAYSPPGSEVGHYYYIGQEFTKNFRTVERYKEYKDVGFNMVMSGCVATYYGEDWETSMCKQVMDVAYQAGLEKYIVGDQAFYELSCQPDGVVGEGKRFASEKELDAFVANRIKDYSKHPAFYGVYLKDEPHYYLFKSFGQIYKSIKRVCPKAFVYCNLLPMDTLVWMNERYPKGGTLLERRKKYLEMFLDETGADYIKYDDYMFCYNAPNKEWLLRCLQDAAALCRDRKINLDFIAQSFSMDINGKEYYWTPNEQEMRFQLHFLLAFAVRELGFFTYLSHSSGGGEEFPDDGAMLNGDGEKMPLYYVTQRLIKEAKEIIPVTTCFRYHHSAYDIKGYNCQYRWLDNAVNEKLDNVEWFDTDKESVLVNELYDEENGQYLYAVLNLTDVRSEEANGAAQKTKIQFDKKFSYADVFVGGKWEKVALNDGVLETSLAAGECAYALIY